MDFLGTTLVDVLVFLIPGFIAASIYYTLTPAPRPIPFERIVQALIFTILVQASLFGVRASMLWFGTLTNPIGEWTSDVQLVWSVVAAAALGLLAVWTTNRDWVHAALRKLGITDQTSYSSEWYAALSKNKGYIVLHLKGNRRLYGWPEEWPSVPDEGHFVMARAEWLDDDKRIPLPGVHRILTPSSEVEMVELMTLSTEPTTGENDGRPESTDTTSADTTSDDITATAERTW